MQRADSGWVVPPDDADRLTTAIAEAHDQRQLARERGQRGFDYVRSNYSKETVTEQYNQLLNRIRG